MAKQPIKDPKGGLTAAGRAHFKRTEGANLKPGVKGAADTPEKMRRKGSFLTRFFTNPSGPMTDDKGKPTRLALSAAAWGEPVPKSRSDAANLAAKGRRLLERYESVKKHAQHNQEDHGSWARKGKGGSARDRGSEKLEGLTRATGKRAEQLESMAKAGGFTFNPKRDEMRSSGFVSAVSTEYEEKHEIGEFSAQTIRDYAAKHAEMLAKPNHHLGAWTTTGPDGKTYVYLDVSVVMNSAKEAADMGRKYNQLAIFDLNTFTEWNRYKNPDGEDVYMPVAPYMEGMFSMAKSDGKKGEGVMLIPGEMLDEDGIAAIMAHVQAQSSSQKPDKSAKNS